MNTLNGTIDTFNDTFIVFNSTASGVVSGVTGALNDISISKNKALVESALVEAYPSLTTQGTAVGADFLDEWDNLWSDFAGVQSTHSIYESIKKYEKKYGESTESIVGKWRNGTLRRDSYINDWLNAFLILDSYKRS